MMSGDPGTLGANPNLVEVGRIIAGCFRSLFTANRAMTGLKVATYGGFLTFLGLGLKASITGSFFGGSTPSGGGAGALEMSGPDVVQALFGFLGIVLVLCGNIYLRIKRQQHERALIEFATRPGLSPKVLHMIESLM
jgi:hypothetical protein